MDISVIIVTYNSADHVAACLRSVMSQSGVMFETIVVDNDSQDDTLAQLAGFNVKAISSGENLGFGRGCNLGFASSTGRYVYLLNPDAQLEGNKALAKLCQMMDSHPQWGMAGTRILSAGGNSESPPATEYPAERHVHRDFSKLPGKVAWILGASMVVRRGLYVRLGGFDPAFFLYSEETDFCLRIREAGFEIGHVLEVAVKHIGGASENSRDPYDISKRKLEGLMRFRQKHYSREDCVFLAKRDLRRAGWRVSWNHLLALFQPRHSTAWRKGRNYRAVREVSREYLAQAKAKM